jgi:hypothetical protein
MEGIVNQGMSDPIGVELDAYLQRCGALYRVDLAKSGGKAPKVFRCPQPANEVEEQALNVWMETMAELADIPYVSAVRAMRFDA